MAIYLDRHAMFVSFSCLEASGSIPSLNLSTRPICNHLCSTADPERIYVSKSSSMGGLVTAGDPNDHPFHMIGTSPDTARTENDLEAGN